MIADYFVGHTGSIHGLSQYLDLQEAQSVVHTRGMDVGWLSVPMQDLVSITLQEASLWPFESRSKDLQLSLVKGKVNMAQTPIY